MSEQVASVLESIYRLRISGVTNEITAIDVNDLRKALIEVGVDVAAIDLEEDYAPPKFEIRQQVRYLGDTPKVAYGELGHIFAYDDDAEVYRVEWDNGNITRFTSEEDLEAVTEPEMSDE